MVRERWTRLAASGSVLLAFVGLWLGHTIEYARVAGLAGVGNALLGSIHAYMLPFAAALAVLTAAMGMRCWRVWTALGRRLDAAGAAVAAAWRGRRPTATPRAAAVPSFGGRLLALWLPLAAAQVVLYLLQENLEALVAGAPTPGMGAVSGVHWAAPFVQVAVALALAGLVLTVLRPIRRRAAAVERRESLVRTYLRRVGRLIDDCLPRAAWRPAPLETFGRQLWCRPPPGLRSA